MGEHENSRIVESKPSARPIGPALLAAIRKFSLLSAYCQLGVSLYSDWRQLVVSLLSATNVMLFREWCKMWRDIKVL
jgi:hypothetical protein